MAKSKRTKQPLRWKAPVSEFFSIVVGVLVALAVDEWNENRQNAERAQRAMENIRIELVSNQRVLDIIHPGNLLALEVLESELDVDEDSLTIMPGLQLQETAWKTMLSTGASAFIPYDELFEVAQLYSIIQIYREIANRFLDQIIESRSIYLAMGNDVTQAEIIRSNMSGLTMMISIEGQLLDSIKVYLDTDPISD